MKKLVTLTVSSLLAFGTLCAADYADISIQDLDAAIKAGKVTVVDVNGSESYTGGHIPGAVNIPWSQATNEADSTFKTAEELRRLYEDKDIKPEKDIIAYCRIGERSSHTWFVLKYLLGYPNVKNYDGSWTEWGNLVNAPIEK